MSSQCKGITKSGSPCKITIVLPNGFCRVHQEQYVVEKVEDTREAEMLKPEIKTEVFQENEPEEKRENIDTTGFNSTSYVIATKNNKRWYLVPLIVFAFLWLITRLLKQKK